MVLLSIDRSGLHNYRVVEDHHGDEEKLLQAEIRVSYIARAPGEFCARRALENRQARGRGLYRAWPPGAGGPGRLRSALRPGIITATTRRQEFTRAIALDLHLRSGRSLNTYAKYAVFGLLCYCSAGRFYRQCFWLLNVVFVITSSHPDYAKSFIYLWILDVGHCSKINIVFHLMVPTKLDLPFRPIYMVIFHYFLLWNQGTNQKPYTTHYW